MVKTEADTINSSKAVGTQKVVEKAVGLKVARKPVSADRYMVVPRGCTLQGEDPRRPGLYARVVLMNAKNVGD